MQMKNPIYNLYMHMATGSVKTQQDWRTSYTIEELENRCLTPDEAFKEDESRGAFVRVL